MSDLEEACALAKDKPLGVTKFLKKYGLHPAGHRRMSPRAPRRIDAQQRARITGAPAQHRLDRVRQPVRQEGLAPRPGSVFADAIMDRIVHITTWVYTGLHNMREHVIMTQ